jgi:biopolymer transport protein ExbB
MIEQLHQATFIIMFLVAFIAAVIVVERLIFTIVNLRAAIQAVKQLSPSGAAHAAPEGDNLILETVRQLNADRQSVSLSDWQNRADSAFLHVRDELSRRLWILDTTVTAAPLLGLLGTILGIVDTFMALAQSGMSDPQAVSSGIGTALYATALGISVALVGLVFFNFLTDTIERISEHLKRIILLMS